MAALVLRAVCSGGFCSHGRGVTTSGGYSTLVEPGIRAGDRRSHRQSYRSASFDEWSKASFPVDTVAKQEVKYIAKPKPGTILFDEFEALLKNKPSDVIMLIVRTAGEVEQDGKFKRVSISL